MITRAWLFFGLFSLGTAALLAGCEDFDRKQCSSNWECRENFGVGATCKEDNFCQAVAPPLGCQDIAGLNLPPDIFTNRAARETVTIGLIVDNEGQQLARAARIAIEMANIKGNISNIGAGANFKFSAVVCDVSVLPSVSIQTVQTVARFLRDDVEAPVVVLGVNSEILGWASSILSVKKNGGDTSEMLIISANSANIATERDMQKYPNLWTLAASEDAMFRRMGQHLVLRRLKPFIAEQDDPMMTIEERIRAAYVDYLDHLAQLPPYEATVGADKDDPIPPNTPLFIVNTLLRAGDSSDSGATRDSVRRRVALLDGMKSVVSAIDSAAPAPMLRYAERLVPCGTGGCVPENVLNPLEDALACQGFNKIDSVTSVDCESKGFGLIDVDAVIVHSDTRSLVDAFLPTLLSSTAMTAGIALETPGAAAKGEVNTAFFLPPLASSGTTSTYSYNWKSGVEATPGIGLAGVPAETWFQYIEEERFLGVRQAGDPNSAAYVEFSTAGDILLNSAYGVAVSYFTQAYDAVWLAIAAVSARTLDFDEFIDGPSAMAEFKDSGRFSTTIQRFFSGATPAELDAIGITFEPKGSAVVAEIDLIPSAWQKRFEKMRNDKENGEKVIYRLRSASGEIRFANPDFVPGVTVPPSQMRYGGRERVSYDYAIWTIRADTRRVETIEGVVQPLDNSHCLPGIIAPEGKPDLPMGTWYLPENMFVCSSDIVLCRKTFDQGPGAFSDICLEDFGF